MIMATIKMDEYIFIREILIKQHNYYYKLHISCTNYYYTRIIIFIAS